MFGLIARWFVSRSIDEGQDVPSWVARRMERDESLRLFDLASRQMVQRLKDDAPQWVARRADGHEFNARCEGAANDSRIRIVAWLTPVAVSAGLLLTVTLWPTPADPGRERTSDVALRTPQTVSLGLQPLKDRMTEGRKLIAQLTDDARELSNMVVLPQPKQVVTLTAQHARDAGTLFGHGLAILDRAVREKGNQPDRHD